MLPSRPFFAAMLVAAGGSSVSAPVVAAPAPAETVATAGSDAAATEPDWTLLDLGGDAVIVRPAARLRRTPPQPEPLWSASGDDGPLTLKRPLPFADTRVGLDVTLARPAAGDPLVPLPERLASEACRQEAGAAAWATSTIAGAGPLWDSTALETRLDPGQSQGSFAALLTKSVPVGSSASRLTLQSSLRLSAPLGDGDRFAEIDQSARLNLGGGTSVIAGHGRASGEEQWRARIGAEQAVPGGLTLTGMVSEAGDGAVAATMSAAFRTSW